jgi:hypothetical protein
VIDQKAYPGEEQHRGLVRSMVEFFKKFLKKEPVKEEPVSVQFQDLQQWLDKKELVIHQQITEQIARPRERIIVAVEELYPLLDDLNNCEYEDKPLHPKLKRTLKHSLPAFVTGMKITLSRNFSDDPGEFYDQTVELLKTYQKSMKSHGKFIAAVFPEEMKEIRQQVDRIGHELNAITKDMAHAQEVLKGIAGARATYKEIKSIEQEYRVHYTRWEALWKSIPKDEERLKNIEQQISTLSDTAEVREVEQLKKDLSALEEKKKGISIEFSLLMTAASNVMRKVEYIAQKEGNRDLTSEMNLLSSLLDQHDSSHLTEIKTSLGIVMPQIMEMIHRGDVVLKNKSEKELFSNEESFSGGLQRICRDYFHTKDSIDAKMTRIGLSEEAKQKEGLEQKADVIRRKHGDDIDAITEFERSLEGLRSRIPPLIESLQARIRTIEGDGIDLRVEDKDLLLNDKFSHA